MATTAIIPAGGRGIRMENAINKQFITIKNKPIIVHSLEKFCDCFLIDEIIAVVPEEWINFVNQEIIKKYQLSKVKKVVAGGSTRQESVFNGLLLIDKNTDLVLIHDAVRPLISADSIDAVIHAGLTNGAAILAVPALDTIKEVESGVVKSTLDRNLLWQVQTPQVFSREIILEAHQKAIQENIIATDDAALVENLGFPVHIVPGSYENIKITTPDDLALAEFFLSHKKNEMTL